MKHIIYILFTAIILFSNNIFAEETISPSEEAEIQLLQILDNMRNGNNDKALLIAENLIKDFPNFKLGKIIYADLLSSSSKETNAGSKSKDKELNDLKSEAKARINFNSIYKKEDLLPKSIIQLANNVEYAFLIELSKSRLYLIENKSGVPDIIGDFYVSIGKEGFNKKTSGDNKTPVGVYKITSHLIDEDLPELYGDGAFPINYPNFGIKKITKPVMVFGFMEYQEMYTAVHHSQARDVL